MKYILFCFIQFLTIDIYTLQIFDKNFNKFADKNKPSTYSILTTGAKLSSHATATLQTSRENFPPCAALLPLNLSSVAPFHLFHYPPPPPPTFACFISALLCGSSSRRARVPHRGPNYRSGPRAAAFLASARAPTPPAAE